MQELGAAFLQRSPAALLTPYTVQADDTKRKETAILIRNRVAKVMMQDQAAGVAAESKTVHKWLLKVAWRVMATSTCN